MDWKKKCLANWEKDNLFEIFHGKQNWHNILKNLKTLAHLAWKTTQVANNHVLRISKACQYKASNTRAFFFLKKLVFINQLLISVFCLVGLLRPLSFHMMIRIHALSIMLAGMRSGGLLGKFFLKHLYIFLKKVNHYHNHHFSDVKKWS